MDMDTGKETSTNKDGEKLLLERHASSTPLAHTDEPPIATDVDSTSFEVTVETSPSNHLPEKKIKPSHPFCSKKHLLVVL